ncbi:2,5-diketo-D-gluconic acid reductase [Roseomonas mucosa]|uniref:aldo/keto reductase n=1 Tax=Roseomonas mucosa TaxID=207340 RepID=UPI00220F102B|nr:aldo/keto reductase [Roseomonas mucosa]QDJ08457.1 2,5-diketo-D-gluconic acid reductase [Roseomonas mucosa]
MELLTQHGLRMPRLGFGTWPMTGAECEAAVRQALELGYRHIDTAERYENEDAVGAGLAASGLARGDVHLTTKVWWDHLSPQAMHEAMARSLEKLRTDHVDLYLIHWPAKDWDLPRTIEALVRLKEEGKARQIGVANFPRPLLRQVVEELKAPIACLQVEYHVTLGQAKLLDYTRRHDIALTAYSPLARNKVAEIPGIQAIARKHGATPAQVALKWLLDQDGVSAVPKAASRANQQANLDSLKLQLDDEDRAAIARLPKDQRMVSPDFAPDWNDGPDA